MQREKRSDDRGGALAGMAQFVLQLPSDTRVIEGAIRYLVNRCRSAGFSGGRLNLNLQVGLAEALANAMLYGNRNDPEKFVQVEVALDDARVTLCVTDEGEGFDPSEVPDPTLAPNLQRAGGRGVFLIRKLMDEVEYNARGNSVRLVLYREPSLRRASGE